MHKEPESVPVAEETIPDRGLRTPEASTAAHDLTFSHRWDRYRNP